MTTRVKLICSVIFVCFLLLGTGAAQTTPVPCVIVGTHTITQNSKLVCNVQCSDPQGGPCIRFGADHISLRLNGFTITGPAAPPTVCVPRDTFPPEDGISTNGHDNVSILGPGMVQKFRRHGLFLFDGSKVTVKHVTSHHNCFSGLQLILVTNSDIEENVSVKNASASGPFACGGNCISNSNNNRVRRNEFHGNGSIEPGPTPLGAIPNDFGTSLLGTSSGNVVEENAIGGNINGIFIAPLAAGNLISRNIVAGNPPVQVFSEL